MVNNAIITKTTGWLKPTRVAQYSEYGKVNKHTCYAYSSLENIKLKDGKCAYISNTGGVNYVKDNEHKSPLVHCSGYNFNIPNNATVTKVLIRQTRVMGTYSRNRTYIKDALIKLKVGASNTDTGVGNNLSDGKIWNVKTRGLGEYTVGDKMGTVQSVWGVNVTPAVANNQNFGCVVQCTGTGSTWHMPRIDCVEMCIYYTQVNDEKTAPEETSKTENIKTTEKQQSIQIESQLVKQYQPDDSEILQATAESISEDYVYSPFAIWIRYRNYVDSDSHVLLNGYNGAITLTLNSNLRFSDGTRKMTVPAFEFKQNTDTKDIQRGYKTSYKQINVYPVKAGTGTVTATGVHYTQSDNLITTQTINLTVSNSLVSLSNSICELNRVTFKNCDATKGTAICNLGALTGNNLTFNDITTTDKCFFDYDKYRDSEFRSSTILQPSNVLLSLNYDDGTLQLNQFWGSANSSTECERYLTDTGTINFGSKHSTGINYPSGVTNWTQYILLKINPSKLTSASTAYLNITFCAGNSSQSILKLIVKGDYTSTINNQSVGAVFSADKTFALLKYSRNGSNLKLEYIDVNGETVSATDTPARIGTYVFFTCINEAIEVVRYIIIGGGA